MSEESNYYQKILDKLYSFIADRKGRVSFNELIKWAEENNVGSITLSIALNDLVNWGKIIAPEGFFEPENYIVAFPVPRSVEIVRERREEVKEKFKEKAEGKVEEVEEAEEKEMVEVGLREEGEQSQSKLVAIVEGEKTASKELEMESINDEDLRRAIEYLNDYWSVGVIRFLQDLKAMGIPNPDLILKKLINMEYVVYLPIGVINATSKLPKVKRPKKLSEFI